MPRVHAFSIPLLFVALSALAADNEDPRIIEGSTLAPDSVAVAYDVRGQGDPTLVFIHGWSCDREFWHNQVDLFAADYRIVTLDLPGHGKSGKNRESWSIADYAFDIRAVIEHLDLEKVILIGHSMGGPVSVETARLMPERVRGIICVDTLHDLERELKPEKMESFVQSFEDDFEGTIRGFFTAMSASGADSATVKWIVDKAVAADKEIAIALMSDFVNLDLKTSVAELEIPIRCINAAAQPPMRPATEIEKNRKYCDFDATLIESVGHFPHLEKPDVFNEELKAVLEKLASR